MSTDLQNQTARLLQACRQTGQRIVTAESCTGGLIVGALTEIAGSSDVVDRGFVSYSNDAKTEMLGVDPQLISRFGAVSGEVAAAMAIGALAQSTIASLSISVTGIAGPGGGTPEKPVGLVFFGLTRRGDDVIVDRQIFSGDRSAIRHATVVHALTLLERQVHI